MSDFSTFTSEALREILKAHEAMRRTLDHEIGEITEVLNTRLSDSHRFIRFTAMKRGQLECIKVLRNASVTPYGSYLGLKETKELTDQLKDQFIRPFTLEFKHSLMPEVIEALHEHFECHPVEGDECVD